MYQINLLDHATTDLAQLDKQIARRIVKRLNWLAIAFLRLTRYSVFLFNYE